MAQKPLDFQEFLSRARLVHGNKFSYHQSDFTIGKAKTRITCPRHGDFWQMAYSHLRGVGCPMCHKEDKASSVFGFGINDYDKPVTIDNSKLYAYEVWTDMIKRCYKGYRLEKYPTYQGCKVCDEWRYFSKFKEWFDENYVEGSVLDKDLLGGNSKIYSPQTCCFIPPRLNIILAKHSITIYKRSDKYVAYLRQDGTRQIIGHYATPQQVVKVYVATKLCYMIKLAGEYLKDGLITEAVYDAVTNYSDPYLHYNISSQSIGSPLPMHLAHQHLNAFSGEASTSSM